jgi:hypothetical protein
MTHTVLSVLLTDTDDIWVSIDYAVAGSPQEAVLLLGRWVAANDP